MAVTNSKEISDQKAGIQNLLQYILAYGSQEDIDTVERWIVNVARYVQFNNVSRP